MSTEATTLWYRRPAAGWLEALPIGNGRLGAMVFGGAPFERLQLNEDTLWSGFPREHDNSEARSHLAEVRRLVLAERDYVAASELTRRMQGPFTESYQPLGDLRLALDHGEDVADYRRELDLDAGVAGVSYRVGGVRYAREVFASAPDDAIVLRLTCDRPGALGFTVALGSPHGAKVTTVGANGLLLEGKAPSHVDPNYLPSDDPIQYDSAAGHGMRFAAALRVLNEGGEVTAGPASLRVRGASSATLLLVAATGFRGFDRMPDLSASEIAERCRRTLDAAAAKGYDALRAAHVADHQALFRRVSIDLGRNEASALPTDERLRRFADAPDPSLVALYFQYGRYLLVASSRSGTQAANLQGIWNEAIRPPWSSNYTLNINVQMNYWPAEVCSLAECAEPLFDLVAELAANGRMIAETNYGCRGWVAHHNTDIWRPSSPVGNHGWGEPNWAMWPLAGPWLLQHLWEHYAFGGDLNFLSECAYPLMRGAAEFLLDWLVEDGEGFLTTCPSTSPENLFLANGQRASVSAGTAMDLTLVRDLFANCVAASEALGVDAVFRAKMTGALARLRPLQVSPAGTLQEWSEDFPDAEPGHRHVSHLVGVFSGDQITPRGTPDLAAAAARSLDKRLQHGSGYTGWSAAWIAALWARLEQPERAWEMLRKLLNNSTYPNLFDGHPLNGYPDGVFQIDGNFGGAAAIAEMLLQSHAGEISLLPAVPADWRDGCARGLRARGGLAVDVEWREGALASATLRTKRDGTVRVRARAPFTVASGGRPVDARWVEPTVAEFAVAAGAAYDVAGEQAR